MNKELIEALKKNEKPFGLMSAELQEAIKTVRPKDIQCFLTKSPAEWGSCDNFSWTNMGKHFGNTYRLRPDYEPASEIVEREIYRGHDGHLYFGSDDPAPLCEAIDSPDFIGFKFKDGSRMPFPICYGLKGRLGYGVIADVDALDEEPVVYHATHCLFREVAK